MEKIIRPSTNLNGRESPVNRALDGGTYPG
jgi:hypothetical protein